MANYEKGFIRNNRIIHNNRVENFRKVSFVAIVLRKYQVSQKPSWKEPYMALEPFPDTWANSQLCASWVALTSFLLTNGNSNISKEDSTSSFVKISHLYGTSYWSTCKNPVLPLATLENGNIKAKLKTSEKWVTVTSPDDLFKHGIDVDYKKMGCGEILNN